MPARRGLITPVPQAGAWCWRSIRSGARMMLDCTRWITASPFNVAPIALPTIDRAPSHPITTRHSNRRCAGRDMIALGLRRLRARARFGNSDLDAAPGQIDRQREPDRAGADD